MRTEFGANRTVCACGACRKNCRFISGYLIPADLERMREALGTHSLEQWAESALLASPGAVVASGGVIFRIPTLVPNRKANGHCVFLSPDEKCTIHEISPFGCAFFDEHMSDDEATALNNNGLREVMKAFENNDAYAQIWHRLHSKGLVAESANVVRERMAAEK